MMDLFPDLPPVDVAESPKRKPRTARKPDAPAVGTQPPMAGAPLQSPESMATALDGHPDFRVLRRLKPCLDWPAAHAMGESGERLQVIVLDTETTGLDCATESIIELAMLRVQVDRASGLPVGPVQVLDALEDPGKSIPKEVVSITGITDADVKGKRIDDGLVQRMLDGADLVVAHNAGFDRPFVERRFPAFAAYDWACSFADIPWKALGRSSAKLESLAQDAGWFYDAHRAEMDCHALLSVLAAPLPDASGTGLAVLMQAARQTQYRLQATHAPFDAKDRLKSRGYRWNAEQRVWHTRLPDEASLRQEIAWLRDNAYGGRAGSVQVEEVAGRERYSNRPGALRTERF